MSFTTDSTNDTFVDNSTDEAAVHSGDMLGENVDFLIGINGFTKTKVDTALEVVVDEERYFVDLSENDQKEIWDALDDQCRKLFSRGCDALLGEARKRMVE